MTAERPSPERTAAIRELAENVLAQTWGGGELPIGPGISGSFTNNVRRAKDLARGTLDLLAALAAETARANLAEKRAKSSALPTFHPAAYEIRDLRAERDALAARLEQARVKLDAEEGSVREALYGIENNCEDERLRTHFLRGWIDSAHSRLDAALAALQEAPPNERDGIAPLQAEGLKRDEASSRSLGVPHPDAPDYAAGEAGDYSEAPPNQQASVDSYSHICGRMTSSGSLGVPSRGEPTAP